jgi:hypothetical protein
MIGSTLNFTRNVAGALLLSATMAASAQALPQFTFNPSAVGLNGAQLIADNILISDYATVAFTPTGPTATFVQSGVLAVGAFQLGAAFVVPPGLNVTYGLYFGFDATGTINTPTWQIGASGTFSTVNFTLWGHDIAGGPGSLTYQPTNTTPTGATNLVALATGSLIGGSVGSTESNGLPVPNAQLTATFAPTVVGSAFFVDPNPFYNLALAAFTNTLSQIRTTPDGFIIDQGGGVVNFQGVSTPEPASMALLGAGLLGLGFLRRRPAA